MFFLCWGVLHDSEETPWIPAGILASGVLGSAVVLREIILRTRRNRLIWAQEQLDGNLKNVRRRLEIQTNENKLTLEKNAVILNRITEKSEAAKVLGKSSEIHWEVFEMCDDYLHRSREELETIGAGSPRLAAIKQGREKIRRLHKFHLLVWSSAQSRALLLEAKTSAAMSNKMEIAAKALSVIESAIEFYPTEQTLLESENVVKEFIAAGKVSHWIEQAERCRFKGNYKRALDNYRDALFYLARGDMPIVERDAIAAQINLEIEKIKRLAGEKREINPPPG